MPHTKHHRAELWISLSLALAVASCNSGKTPANQNTGGTSAGTNANTATNPNTDTVANADTATNTDTSTASQDCGKPNQACCLGDHCVDGGCCVSGTCLASGATCDTGMGGGVCISGICMGCGAPGLPCCGSDPTTQFCIAPGSTCSSGSCVAAAADPGSSAGPTNAASGACAGGTATPCSGLPAFAGKQVLDGNDDDFCTVPSFELNFENAARVKEYNGSGGSYPERALARVAWDSSGIHAFIHVVDPKFVPATDLGTIYNADGIELLFSSTTSGLSGGTAQDSGLAMHVIISPPLAVRSQATGSNGNQVALDPSLFKADTESTGYKVELDLPWPGTPPAAGSQIKFDMELNSADGVSTNGDAGPRDAQAILYQGSDPGDSPCGGELFPYCDDRLWCSTPLQ